MQAGAPPFAPLGLTDESKFVLDVISIIKIQATELIAEVLRNNVSVGGNVAVGSQDLTSRIWSVAAGANYKVSPDTLQDATKPAIARVGTTIAATRLTSLVKGVTCTGGNASKPRSSQHLDGQYTYEGTRDSSLIVSRTIDRHPGVCVSSRRLGCRQIQR